MCRHHAPALRHAHPGLALAPGAGRAGTRELDIGDGMVTAEGGDLAAGDRAFEICGGSALAEGLDGGEAVKGFARAIAQGEFVVPEQAVEHIDVVADQGVFVLIEYGFDLGQYVGKVDLHGFDPC
ncbi:hypothetical protein SDC9_161137 [bioreactor metagenome]|uniref:Uncharacterized protein n=1 Tax=bioreactor metagenome TaxID=1076179 RepID=A0A645FHG2_9ZZZZ